MLPADNNGEKSSVLKQTREAKGMTLEIVHEATKIPMDALKAIEEGYSVRILSPFYYRGFIKIYAEFLGLNAAEIYKHYGLDQPVKPASTASQPAKPATRKPQGPNLFMEQMQEGFAFFLKPKTLMMVFKIIGFIFLMLLLVKAGGCVASHLGKRTKKLKSSIVVYHEKERPLQQDVDWDEKSTPLSPPEVKHQVLPVQSVDDNVEVAVRANRNTWIQVRADGKVVFQMTLSKGSMESWSALKKIELSGRNIEQLDMEVNGKHVGTLGGGERRIRKVLITKEGLTVKK